MTLTHAVSPVEIGMIRIYMKPGDKLHGEKRRNLWNARPLYHPATGVPFARRSTVVGERPASEPHPIADEVRRQADAALVS